MRKALVLTNDAREDLEVDCEVGEEEEEGKKALVQAEEAIEIREREREREKESFCAFSFCFLDLSTFGSLIIYKFDFR